MPPTYENIAQYGDFHLEKLHDTRPVEKYTVSISGFSLGAGAGIFQIIVLVYVAPGSSIIGAEKVG